MKAETINPVGIVAVGIISALFAVGLGMAFVIVWTTLGVVTGR